MFTRLGGLLGALMLLTGCGGGGGAGGSSPGQTYALGGSISGLTVAGLVLSDGKSTVSPAAGDASFQFPDKLASGTAFAVQVASAPAGYTCSVVNGTGSIQSADQRNVVVTCAANAYTLGGTISGLSAFGLVLSDGSEEIAPAIGSSSFTFPTTIATGSSYSVSVVSSPSGYVCTAGGSYGTMSGGTSVSSVSITCARGVYLGGTIRGLAGNFLQVATVANASNPANPVPDASNSVIPSPDPNSPGYPDPAQANPVHFVLPVPVTFGKAYAVMIAGQPLGETCSIIQGGAVTVDGSQDPANAIVIQCAARSFPLTGSVTLDSPNNRSVAGLSLASASDPTNRVAVSDANLASYPAFTLPNPIAFGSSYTVTVTQQPASGLICTAATNTGVVSDPNASALNPVAVTCSEQAYTLGGTVTGLTAGGLMLTDGTDTVTLGASAGAFTFPTGLANQSSYAVRVQTQPAGLYCAVADLGGGVINAADASANLAVSCQPAQIVHSFAGPFGMLLDAAFAGDGANPSSALTAANDGTSLFGVTGVGGAGFMAGNVAKNAGTIYSITTSGTYTLLYSFDGAGTSNLTGNDPVGIIQGRDGMLYGVTAVGGFNDSGVVFRFDPVARAFTALYGFGPATATGDGFRPNGGLVQGLDGWLYGTTRFGGGNHTGTVFRVSTAGSFQLLYSFGALSIQDGLGTNPDGAQPAATLIQGPDGSLYGSTTAGGGNGTGTVFAISTAGTLRVLHTFGAAGTGDGAAPARALLLANDGLLYGTTSGGGTGAAAGGASGGGGTLFRLDTIDGSKYAVLYDFDAGNGTDGTTPDAALLQGQDGLLYGTTTTDATAGTGTLFRFDPIARVLTYLPQFLPAGSAGSTTPSGGLLQTADGSIYGSSENGGNFGHGTLFRFHP